MNETKSVLGNPAGYKLFFNERDSDVAVKVEYEGEKWQFPAHKLVLCTMSDVFRTMLDSDMIEKSTKTITIRDSSPQAVKQFLRYLYMGIVDFNSWYEATNLLKIAHKYNVQTLINLCESYLTSNVIISNCCLLYELARTYSLSTLKKESRDLIFYAGFIVSATDGFFDLKPKSMEYFLSSPLLNVENEGCVLTSLKEWAVCECSRKCIPLTRLNILTAMKPFLKFIRWNLIPQLHRTFIPTALVEELNSCPIYRKPFFVPSPLQYHMSYIKFVLELGTFYEEKCLSMKSSMSCMKFSVDSHVFLVGFRIVGLFHGSAGYSTNPHSLILGRDDNKVYIQFNLNSLPWSRGATVGCHVWREMIAYTPYPIRLDPFSMHFLSLQSSKPLKPAFGVKWPRTRLDTATIVTDLGTIGITSHEPSYCITQLFVLPAPPYRSICNDDDY